ncbi:MAG TPA: hypothetical protein VHQ01_06440 [Pyrinomonadaceae bacterium]|jgi:hypothetical protein|nr:hypothetical protein [Pyrinomonadaceae bacterium]
MKNRNLCVAVFAAMLLSLSAVGAFAQKAAAKPIIFAVLGDGKSLEPIAYINKNKLEPPANGSDAVNIVAAFNKAYYKPGAVYKLIFGGASAGTVTAKSSDAKAECSKNVGTATTSATKTPLKGLVMGLATNGPVKTTTVSYRRKPTAAEKDEIDALAKAEFVKQKLTPKVLRYQNLTALDVDNDGKADIVGSYWVEIDKQTRGLLFFIASKDSKGKYAMGYHEYRSIDQANVMSGEIKAVDDGVLHELLLDVYDFDGDGTAEIFTYEQSFEGAGFNVYHRSGSKWTRIFEGSNYHCGY